MTGYRKITCLRGHHYTIKNTYMNKLKNGRFVRKCKRCQSERNKLRYETDPEYRTLRLAQRKKAYHDQKARRLAAAESGRPVRRPTKARATASTAGDTNGVE